MKKKDNLFVNGDGTVIAKGTVVDGNVKTTAATRVDGQVNGDIVSEGIVIVGECGVVNGAITAAEVRIAGKVTGNVSVSGKIDIMAKGYLLGDIKTSSLNIDEDALFQGKCTMMNMPEEAKGKKAKTKTAKPAVAKAESKKESKKEAKKEVVIQESTAEEEKEQA